MKSYHATLNLTFEAHNEEEALEIAQVCRDAIVLILAGSGQVSKNLGSQSYKVKVDIDDVEEN